MTKSITEQKLRCSELEYEYGVEVNISKKEQEQKDKLDVEMSVYRRNIYKLKSSTAEKSGVEVDIEESVTKTAMSRTHLTKCATNDDTSLVATQVGLVNISTISADGLRVSGYLNSSPRIKFFSGLLFKDNNNNTNKNKVREKAKQIKCITSFSDDVTGKKYHLTSIGSHGIKAISFDTSNPPNVQSFSFMSITSRLNWIIEGDVTATNLCSVNHVFGEPVMPSSRCRVRKSGLLSNKYKPIADDKRKRNAPMKKTGINEVYSRYRSSKLSPSDLIKKALEKEPLYASCLELTKDEKGIYDNVCKKQLPIVFKI